MISWLLYCSKGARRFASKGISTEFVLRWSLPPRTGTQTLISITLDECMHLFSVTPAGRFPISCLNFLTPMSEFFYIEWPTPNSTFYLFPCMYLQINQKNSTYIYQKYSTCLLFKGGNFPFLQICTDGRRWKFPEPSWCPFNLTRPWTPEFFRAILVSIQSHAAVDAPVVAHNLLSPLNQTNPLLPITGVGVHSLGIQVS